jgi:hypothetical protein
MPILILLIFISLVLVMGALVLFVFTVRNQDIQQADHISLMPLEEDDYKSVH